MKAEYKPFVDELIELCIKEDIGDGDHTSLSCIPSDEHGRMRLLCKQEGIIAGIEIAQVVFHRLDPEMEFEQVLSDGDRVKPGDVAFYVSGRLRSLLQAERIILNIMQRMSGVATQTAVYVDRLAGLHTRVLDTRKTTPGMRVLDKMAVKIGGGENHRMGLFDMILLKDNHIDFAGGIRKAIHGAREYLRAKGKDIPIECREEGRRPLRDRIERRHHALDDARLRRMRRRLHLGRCPDAPDQVARHVAQGLRITQTPCRHRIIRTTVNS